MNQQSSPEREPSPGRPGEPDHKVPDRFKTSLNPGVKFVNELLMGPDYNYKPKVKDKSKPVDKDKIGKEGVSRTEFRHILERTKVPFTELDRDEKRALEKDLERGKYGETINDEDVNRYLRHLEEEKFRTKGNPEQRDELDQEIKIFKKIKEQK